MTIGSCRRPQTLHGNVQDRSCRIAIEVSLAHPFRWRVQQVVGRNGEFAEVTNLASDEIEGECFYIAEQSRVVVMKSCFRKIAELVVVLVVAGGQRRFGEMSELGPEATAGLVGVAPGYKTLVEDSRPGMMHGVFDIRHRHLGFGLRQPVVGNRQRSTREPRPIGVVLNGLQTLLKRIRLRPAVRFGKN